MARLLRVCCFNGAATRSVLWWLADVLTRSGCVCLCVLVYACRVCCGHGSEQEDTNRRHVQLVAWSPLVVCWLLGVCCDLYNLGTDRTFSQHCSSVEAPALRQTCAAACVSVRLLLGPSPLGCWVAAVARCATSVCSPKSCRRVSCQGCNQPGIFMGCCDGGSVIVWGCNVFMTSADVECHACYSTKVKSPPKYVTTSQTSTCATAAAAHKHTQ